MGERLRKIGLFLRRNLDRAMIVLFIALAAAIVVIRLIHADPPPFVSPTPRRPPLATPFEDSKTSAEEQELPAPYDTAIDFLKRNPKIEEVADGKFMLLVQFNAFDKKIAVRKDQIMKETIRLVKDAQQLFSQNDFEGCIQKCLQVISKDPGSKPAQELLEESRAKLKEREPTEP
ncbi:hypothetical protein ACFL34_05095 [Candidatus Sumerlaeota bacterium]